MRCSKCGNELRENEMFCGVCGTKAELPVMGTEKNLCPKCHKEVNADEVFCGNCGYMLHEFEPISERVEETCPFCGGKVTKNAEFCGNCGEMLIKSANNPMSSPKKKSPMLTVLLIIAISVVIGASPFVGWYFISKDSDTSIYKQEETAKTDKKDKAKATPKSTEAPEEQEDSEETEEPEETKKPKETSTPEPDVDFEESGDYLFPSNSQYITERDLRGKSMDEVALIRNEIYARHGYMFQTEPFVSYFNNKSWYRPNPGFNESMFNPIERANKDFIVKYESDRGWR